jgi:sulfopropanediol 3-dehydrogenase
VIGEQGSRLCGYEHMSGHKEQADIGVLRLQQAAARP